MRSRLVSLPSNAALDAAGRQLLPALIGRVLRVLRHWRAKQAVLAELHALDQWTLYDLRIDRCDFAAIANGTYRREPLSEAEATPDAAPETTPPPRLWPR